MDTVSYPVSFLSSSDDEFIGNRLVIPVIGVESQIHEGGEEALDKGVWHRPGTSNPVEEGNMVLTGHRFLYTGFNKNTFYNLDKLKIGDEIIVYWEGREYVYLVIDKKVVEDTDVYVEGDFGDERVTLYTCHPLWSADKRLVIVGKPL
ncbi:class E sortase [Candidatus Woesebacteria bacterium]|nr:class E sortase [Candidatus Woesebacteria bacterium]